MPKYHHGDLRNALISIALELLAEEGLHALSLRKMEQKAGVSHNAPHMHFADKEAVLVAIAEEGFRLRYLASIENGFIVGVSRAVMPRQGFANAEHLPKQRGNLTVTN